MKQFKKKTCGWLIYLFTAWMAISCTSSPEATTTGKTPDTKSPSAFTSLEDKFIGEWTSIEFPNRPHFKIVKNGGNFIIQEGKGDFPAVFDKEHEILRFNAPGATFDIAYLEKEDVILISGGGKYRRVSASN